MKKLLLFLLIPIGLGGGMTAGYALKPPAEEEGHASDKGKAAESSDGRGMSEHADTKAKPADEEMGVPDDLAKPLEGDPDPVDYVKLDRQFVVPLISDGKVSAMVVISMAVEADPGATDLVFAHEPKLRDGFLKVLFTHAQSGGFEGSFTNDQVLADLRTALNATARAVVGTKVRQVLLTSVVRQDL